MLNALTLHLILRIFLNMEIRYSPNIDLKYFGHTILGLHLRDIFLFLNFSCNLQGRGVNWSATNGAFSVQGIMQSLPGAAPVQYTVMASGQSKFGSTQVAYVES